MKAKIKHIRSENLCSLVFSRTQREIPEAFSERNQRDAKNKNTIALHPSVEPWTVYRLASILHLLSPPQEQSWTFIGNYIYWSDNPILKTPSFQQRALYRLNSGWSAYLFSDTFVRIFQSWICWFASECSHLPDLNQEEMKIWRVSELLISGNRCMKGGFTDKYFSCG